MSTCNDCLHAEICPWDCDGVVCEHFKDSSKMLELPCKVGTIVWCIDEEENCTGYIFLGCNEKYAFIKGGINGSFDVDAICDYAYERFLDWEEGIYCVPLSKLHFTKAEAEKALAERSKEDD